MFSFSEVMITTSLSIQGILWNIVEHILPCHTTQLAREYLGLTTADVEFETRRNPENPQAVIVHCLLKFLQKHDDDEDALYECLKRAGVEHGLIPRVCLELYKGKKCIM